MESAGTHKDSATAPVWLLVLPVAYLAHLCEEWWGGPGFPMWTQVTLGADVSEARFLVINATALPLIAGGTIAAVLSRHLAPFVVALSSLFVLNGVVHLLLTLAFATYSPGTITGVVLYLPLGGLALRTMSRRLPGRVFTRSVIAGVVVHAFVSLMALA